MERGVLGLGRRVFWQQRRGAPVVQGRLTSCGERLQHVAPLLAQGGAHRHHALDKPVPALYAGVRTMTEECCTFDEDPDEPGEESWHHHRTCMKCGYRWWALHCVHDGYQNPCPACGVKPEVKVD